MFPLQMNHLGHIPYRRRSQCAVFLGLRISTVAVYSYSSPACPLEFTMNLTPQLLLDTSIAQLQTLAAFLAEEMGEYRQRSVVATPEARACKEILLTISVLIPKLQAARYVVVDDRLGIGRCIDCE